MNFFVLLFAILAYFAAIINADPNVVCFFSSWTTYRSGKGKFDVKDIDAKLCSHVIYGYVGLSGDNKVKILDEWEAIGLHAFEELVALKKVNPDIKILLGMGGWAEGSGKYSKMAADPAARKTLVQDVVDTLKKYSFDGFDLDWESPGERDGSDPEKDPANFIKLLEELKEALAAEKKLLSVTASAFVKTINISYPDTKKVSNAVDLINVIFPKTNFKELEITGVYHPFPLHGSSKDKTVAEKNLNIEAGIKYWLEKGADPKKINLGVGTYGTNFILVDPKNSELYAPFSGCDSGPYTNEGCILGYNEFCELDNDWARTFDDEQKVPHFVHESKWIGIDDPESIALKADFVKEKGLAGVMVWNLDGDDFRNTCSKGNYPLLTALNKALKK